MKKMKWIGMILALTLVAGLLGGCRSKEDDNANNTTTAEETTNRATEDSGINDMTSTATDHTENGTDDTYDGTVTGTQDDGGLIGDITNGIEDIGEDISEGVSNAGEDATRENSTTTKAQ